MLDPLDFAPLGTLNLPAGDYTIDTDTLTISDNTAPGVPLFTGVVDNQNGQADTSGGVWDPVANPGQLGIPEIAVFTFDGIDLQPSANVTITGTRAIALLSRGDATIGTPLSVDGDPGHVDTTGPVESYGGQPSLPSPGGFAGGTPILGGEASMLFTNRPDQQGYFVPGDGPGAGDSAPVQQGGFSGFQGSASFGGQGLPVSGGFDPSATYGDLTQTLQGGSGGGSSVATVVGPLGSAALTGGGGGGAIEIGAVGAVVIDAEVSARGGLVSDPPNVEDSVFSSGGRAGGGSGGGIRVHGQRVTLDAPLVADGSVRPLFTERVGGGGRIFVLNREADATFEYVLGSTAPPDPSFFDNLFARGSNLSSVDGDGVLTVTPGLTVVPLGQTASFDSVAGQVPFSGPNGDYLVEFFVTNVRVLSGGQADIGAGFTNNYEIELAGPTASLIGVGSLTNTNEITGAGRIEVPFTNAAGGELNAVNDTLVLTQPVSNASGASINAIGSTLSFEGGLTNEGDLNLINTTVEGDVVNNGAVALAGTNTFTGTVTGSGAFLGGGTAAFAGTLAPDSSPGMLAFEGDLRLEPTATIEIEIGGATPGVDYDRIEVDGFATLEGTLEVGLLNGFIPELGDRFAFLSAGGAFDASFAAINLPDLSAEGLAWELNASESTLSLEAIPALDGDYNLDGTVNTADYAVWRDGLGTKFTPNDYGVWLANVGATAPAPSNAIPEPTAGVLALIVVTAAATARGVWRS